MSGSPSGRGASAPTAWRTVTWLGLVSLFADLVYEGLRSITGPFLAGLGAGAVLVGVVTGAGEALALVLRLAAGPWADRTGRYWSATIAGYALTGVAVPLLAITPFIGGAGLALACALVLVERTGKAVRSPAKSVLLAHASADVGRGRGFGVHKALDQVGAFAGPLVVAGLAALTGALWPGLAVMVVPGGIAVALLLALRVRRPDLGAPVQTSGPADPSARAAPRTRERLPRLFHAYAAATALATAGLLTFGVLSFRLVDDRLVSPGVVPLVYAAAMAAEAVAALVTGWGYDRVGGGVLLVLPPLVAAVPALVLLGGLGAALAGVVLWGAATGLQDSTVKALVADLVPGARLGTAYGAFAAYQGVAALAGGALGGLLYASDVALLVAGVASLQVVALVGLVVVLRRRGR